MINMPGRKTTSLMANGRLLLIRGMLALANEKQFGKSGSQQANLIFMNTHLIIARCWMYEVILTRKLNNSVFSQINYSGNTVTIDDTLSNYLDVISVNEYFGWYRPWPRKPENVIWKSLQ